MVQVDMLTGKYKVMKVMLDVSELVYEFPSVVVVDKHDCARNLFILCPLFFDKPLSYKVPYGFRTIFVFLFLKVPIKIFQEPVFSEPAAVRTTSRQSGGTLTRLSSDLLRCVPQRQVEPSGEPEDTVSQ